MDIENIKPFTCDFIRRHSDTEENAERIIQALNELAAEVRRDTLEGVNESIKHMVDRFLGWKLPSDFDPDGGISLPRAPICELTGTHLFTAKQATEMVEYMFGDSIAK